MEFATQRAAYRPSGRVDWARFLPWAGLVVLTSVVLAALQYLAFISGLYLIVLLPLGFAGGLGFLAGHAVTAGHCRSPGVAFLLSVAAALIMFFGYFYISMLSVIGWKNFKRVDVVPRYIQMRMATDTIHDSHSYNPTPTPRAPGTADKVFNWIFFTIEATGVPALVVGMAMMSARRSYCEQCRRWKERHRAIFPRNAGNALIEALHTGRLSALAEIPTVPPSANTKFAVLFVETCCSEQTPTPQCSHYFSVGVLPADQNGVLSKSFGIFMNRPMVDRVELNAEELAHVAVKFSDLRFAAAPVAPPIVETGTADCEAILPQERFVEQIAVPAPNYGAALPNKVALMAGFLDLLPAIMMPVGLFGGLGCAIFLDPRSYSGTLTSTGYVLVWIGIVAGVIILLYGGYLASWRGSPWSLPYLQKSFRAAIANRPDRWIDPNDNTAQLVEICPREEWGVVTVRSTNELGLLKIDLEQRALVFEGNKKRFRVPVEALLSCEIEQFTLKTGHTSMQSIMVILRAKDKMDNWEAPVQPKLGHTLRSKPKMAAAVLLQAEILKLRNS